ncbi:MAG: MFS transporter [Anaerolineae bacterium]|nr:MFS transporter [Anaerolineae bacterium]
MAITEQATTIPALQPRAAWWRRALFLAPPANVAAHNARAIYMDIAVGNIAYIIVTHFLAVFAVRLGASDLLVGALTAGPYLVALVLSLPAARLVNDEKRLLPNLVWSIFLYRIPYLMFALIPVILSRFQAEALALTNLLGGIPFSMINVAFFTMFAYAIPPEQRAHVMSRRSAIGSLTAMLGLLLAGFWLERLPFPFNYEITFFACFLISLGSVWYVSRIYLSPRDPPLYPPAVSLSWRARWAQIKGQHRFVRFAICATALITSISMLQSLYPIMFVNRFGASDGWISLLWTIYNATSFVAALGVDRVLRRWGTRYTLVLTGVGLGIYAIAFALAPSVPSLVPLFVFSGTLIAGFNVGLPHGLVETCPEENRADFTALYMVLVNVATFAGPLLGSVLSTAFGVVAAIIIVGALRAGAGLLSLWLEY